jgi:hypothetical protein
MQTKQQKRGYVILITLIMVCSIIHLFHELISIYYLWPSLLSVPAEKDVGGHFGEFFIFPVAKPYASSVFFCPATPILTAMTKRTKMMKDMTVMEIQTPMYLRLKKAAMTHPGLGTR